MVLFAAPLEFVFMAESTHWEEQNTVQSPPTLKIRMLKLPVRDNVEPNPANELFIKDFLRF
jgi:hypothetical protein